ncbi:glycosyltransferase family 39 protein, partial [Candidatus Sumerlaeota bacterium]|nr:glycosyltransferase family 39 protein [Candidatus Sumerlaeota bacterium]
MTLESTKPRESESGGRFWIWFAGIVFFALLIRAVNAHFLLQDDNPHYRAWIFPDTDMARNHNYAKEILANRGFPKDFFQHSPLYPCIIASVYAFAPDRFDLVYRLQYFAGALLCGLIYWVGRRLWNEPVGRVAGIGAAVYGPLIFNEVTFMSDSLSPVFVTAFIALVLIYERAERGHLPLAAAIGLSLGLATGERSNMALLGVALVPWMWFVPRHIPLKTRLISLALIAAVSIAVISPFCYHNTMVRGQLSFTQGEPNITFRVGWGVESPGYFNFPNGWPNNPMLTPFSPGFLLLLARKIRFYLSWFEFPDLYNYYIDGRFSPLIKYNPFTFAL